MWSLFKFFRPNQKSLSLNNRSKLWPAKRKEHLDKYPCCAVCGSYIRPEVHHIIPFHVDPSKELEDTNLITLCGKYCHFVFGHLMNWSSWNTDILSDSQIFNKKINNRP